MASTFEVCGPEVGRLADKVIEAQYHDLKEAGVTVGFLFGYAPKDLQGQPRGPALKHHGWPAAAIVKVNSLKDRVEGKPDSTIQIDGDRWPHLAAREQEALLSHELRHLLLMRDAEGTVRRDDAGRPKLKLRPHDYECAGFYDVAERYGDHAAEVRAMRSLSKDFVQGCFNWG